MSVSKSGTGTPPPINSTPCTPSSQAWDRLFWQTISCTKFFWPVARRLFLQYLARTLMVKPCVYSSKLSYTTTLSYTIYTIVSIIADLSILLEFLFKGPYDLINLLQL